MLKNYLKVAIRNITKHKLYTFINIFGLAFGLGICLIVLGHISYELSFEDVHENKDRIFRINGTYANVDTLISHARITSELGLAIKEELPEVEKSAIFRLMGDINLKIGEERFKTLGEYNRKGYEFGGNAFYANPDFLEVFTIPIVSGNPDKALINPNSLLISEKIRDEFFPDSNPVGQSVKINDNLECQVTGIIKDIPQNTQVHCDFIISQATIEKNKKLHNKWHRYLGQDYVYLLLKESSIPLETLKKITQVVQKHIDPKMASRYNYNLQPLGDIYFSVYDFTRRGELYPGGEASMIYVIVIVALFVLLLAVVNFVNLATAKSADRIREVGVRKVFGALRKQLIKQYLCESLVITLISVMIGVVIYEVFRFWVKPMLVREVFADFYSNIYFIISLFVLIATVSILAGMYPALYLSRFKPIVVLQNNMKLKSSKSFLRKALVVFQFTIAIGFICSTVIIFKQLNFLTAIDLGFNKENILLLEFEGKNANENCLLVKNEIERNNKILSATATNNPPGKQSSISRRYYIDDKREKSKVAKNFYADYEFLSTFSLEIMDGQNFTPQVVSSIKNPILINEGALKELNIHEPIGYKLYSKEDYYEVVGVVKDFHGSPLNWRYHPISVINYNPVKAKTLCLKIPSENIQQTISEIRETWQKTLPQYSFKYSFLDDEIEKNYDEIRSQVSYFLVFSIITIAIACLGIYGLVSYTSEKRSKEIGIRKVMGASVNNVISMLSKEFFILIVIANAIAWPLAFMAMSGFLSEFPFRVTIGLDTFLLTGILVIALAIMSAGFQAYWAAINNPIDSLRYE